MRLEKLPSRESSLTTHPSPIALFAYTRARHTRDTIEALRKNELADESHLIVFSDGPKDDASASAVRQVRSYLRTVKGFKQIDIVERDRNFGFSKSIISGVDEVLSANATIIVIEDDIVTAPYFLRFVNTALARYRNEKIIFSITGFSPPPLIMTFPDSYTEEVYLNPRCSPWGWATWKDRWQSANWNFSQYSSYKNSPGFKKEYSLPGADRYDLFCSMLSGRIHSWDIVWDMTHHVNHAFCLYPRNSLVNNIGFDGSGVNCGKLKANYMENSLVATGPMSFPESLRPNHTIIHNYSRAFGNRYSNKAWRIYRIIVFSLINRIQNRRSFLN